MVFAAVCLLSYLVGSIPFGYLIAWRHGVDIRASGSGNIGATNVGRRLGRRLGALVFVLDALKGALPAWSVLHFSQRLDLAAAAGLAALIGHMFPLWLRFRGGRGVATGTGAVVMLLPGPALIALPVWLATLAATRIVSLASMLAAAAMAGATVVLAEAPFTGPERILTLFALAAFFLVVFRHADNIARLVRGRENQIAETRLMRQLNRIIHILALGLWFGSNVFFTFVAAVLIFKTWEAYGEAPPDWLSGRAYMTRETGTRIAGATVAPIFPFFFMVQGVCALLALITSVGFSRGEPGRRIHRVRFYVILLAALTVTFGWPLSQMVGELRDQRYSADRAVAEPARAEFGRLHAASLFLNFGTVALVATALALGASLPGETAAKNE